MLESLPNHQAGFGWKVFSLGRTSQVQVDCNMNIKRVLVDTETTTQEVTTAEMTTALATVGPTTLADETTTQEVTTTQE